MKTILALVVMGAAGYAIASVSYSLGFYHGQSRPFEY